MSAPVTGAAYVEAMNRDPDDREYRRAFQQLALTLVARGGSVFDFGCGPGIDARDYARLGRRVRAFDADADMADYFMRHCASELAAGSVRLDAGTYADFLDAPHGGVDLITANFAPLNLVLELRPLFEKFSSMLEPGGQVLASVLNPFFHALWTSPRPRGWTGLPRLLLQGHFTTLLHGVIPVRRWLPRRLAREASPWFELAGVHVPQLESAGQPARCVDTRRPGDWPVFWATQFLFLQLRRRAT